MRFQRRPIARSFTAILVGGATLLGFAIAVSALDAPSESKLTSLDAEALDEFGRTVDMSGNRIVVAAPFSDEDAGSNAGSVYVFETNDAGALVQRAKLTATNGAPDGHFGIAIAILNDRIVVGSGRPAAVSVFDLDDGGEFSEVAKLAHPDGDGHHSFGASLGLTNNRIAVGALLDDESASNAGAVFIFEDDGVGGFAQVAKLTASDATRGDNFGSSIGFADGVVVAGAPNHDSGGSGAGAGYVFHEGQGGFAEVAKLTASDAAQGDGFGRSVALSSERIVVGAAGDDDDGASSGSAYVFESNGVEGYDEVAKLTASDADASSLFGSAVDVSGDRIVVGASWKRDDAGVEIGGAYVFDAGDDGDFVEVANLTADDAAAHDHFGGSVTVSLDRVLVGASRDDHAGSNSGSAYVFDFAPGRFDDQTCYTSSDGDSVLITADGFSPGDRAAIRRNGTWVSTQDAMNLTFTTDGSIDDEWVLRVRGSQLPTPYLELPCSNVAGDGPSCTVVDDAGDLRVEFDGFQPADRLNVRRNGEWVGTVSGDVAGIENLAGSAADDWGLRARGEAFENPYSSLDCHVRIIDPPPDPTGCSVAADGLTWADAGVDRYQVRRDGKWLATTDQLSMPTTDLEADWRIRYRLNGEQVELRCEPANVLAA